MTHPDRMVSHQSASSCLLACLLAGEVVVRHVVWSLAVTSVRISFLSRRIGRGSCHPSVAACLSAQAIGDPAFSYRRWKIRSAGLPATACNQQSKLLLPRVEGLIGSCLMHSWPARLQDHPSLDVPRCYPLTCPIALVSSVPMTFL